MFEHKKLKAIIIELKRDNRSLLSEIRAQGELNKHTHQEKKQLENEYIEFLNRLNAICDRNDYNNSEIKLKQLKEVITDELKNRVIHTTND